jgi:ABC-type branched-chain amino acid transport systems, ATPase component
VTIEQPSVDQPSAEQPLCEIEDLVMHFGRVRAVDGVSLRVDRAGSSPWWGRVAPGSRRSGGVSSGCTSRPPGGCGSAAST